MQPQDFAGDHDSLQRLAEQRGDLLDSSSADFDALSRMLSSADDQQMHDALMQAATTTQIGDEHVIGAIGPEELNLIGRSLMTNLEDAGAAGGTESRLISSIPGMLGADLDQFTPIQVTALINFAREKYPEALVRTTEEIARSEPSLLQFIIGQPAVRAVGAKLAQMMLGQKPA